MAIIPKAKSENSTPSPGLLILGGGAVVAELHAPALARLGWLGGASVCEPDGERAAWWQHQGRVLGRFPGLRVTVSDFRSAIRASDAAAALVALPSGMHEEAVTAALERGMHVLCEKPLALSAKSARGLGDLAGRQRRILAVGMVRRLFPGVMALREALAAGLCGELASADVVDGSRYAWPLRSFSNFASAAGGALADMGVHYLDLLSWLLGPLEPVAYEDDWHGGCEANAAFTLRRAADGVPVRLAFSRTRALSNRLELRGVAGRLELATSAHTHCRWMSAAMPGTAAELRPVRESRGPRGAAANWHPVDAFAAQLEAFGRAIASGDAKDLVSAEEAARVAALVEWAYARRSGPAVARLAAAEHEHPTLGKGRIGITGASGFIGGHLLARLWESGHRDFALPVRSVASAAGIARFAVTPEIADLLDPAAMARTFAGCRFVFHLAYGRDGEGAKNATVDGTRHVVDAAIAAGAECIVVLSSTYVWGHPGSVTVDESFPYAAVPEEYGRAKQAMERWCRKRAGQSGKTRIAILNPSCVYGAESPGYTLLPLELARQGRFCWIDGGAGIVNYVYVENLIDAMLLAALNPAAHGEPLIVSDGSCTWREFLTPLLGELAIGIPSYTSAELDALHASGGATTLAAIAGHLARDPRLRQLLAGHPVLGRLAETARRWLPGLEARVGELKRASGAVAPAAPAEDLPPRSLAVIFDPSQTRVSAARSTRLLGWHPRIELAEGIRRARRGSDPRGLVPGAVLNGRH